MDFNVKKSKILLFISSKGKLQHCSLHEHELLGIVEGIMYLGVIIIQSDMKSTAHISLHKAHANCRQTACLQDSLPPLSSQSMQQLLGTHAAGKIYGVKWFCEICGSDRKGSSVSQVCSQLDRIEKKIESVNSIIKQK